MRHHTNMTTRPAGRVRPNASPVPACRPSLAAVAAAGLMLAMVNPADAARAADAAPPVLVAANDDTETSTERASFKGEAEQRLEGWSEKVEALAEEAEAEGSELTRAGARRVEQAWEVTKDKWQALREASAEGWDEARSAFDDAWGDFVETWNEATSEN